MLLAAASSSLGEPAASGHEFVHLDGKAASRLLIHTIKPEYPPIAKVNYIQGRVKIDVAVNAKGRVIEAHVIQGEALLAAAALQSVREWKYRPFVDSGSPTPFRTVVDINFNLYTHRQSDLPVNPEKYLEKQVRPPEVISGSGNEFPFGTVELRVLVGAKGQVLDSVPFGNAGASLHFARKKVRHWKFRPARWGALRIPWYLVVKVPIESPLKARKGKNSDTP